MIKTVQYANKHGLKLTAHLYLPADFDEQRQYPALMVGHPVGGVKEQTAGLYAKRLAELGFVTLAFDATYQGESEGLPRHTEDPDSRVEDFRITTDYLTTLSYVDKERIGAVGVCGSGGYAFKATATDHRIKALATVSAVDVGLTFRRGRTGEQNISQSTNGLWQMLAQIRTNEANGGEVAMGNWVDDELDPNQPKEFQDGHLYYRTARAMHPNSPNRFPMNNFDRILGFSAFSLAELISQPVLMIAGDEALTAWQSKETMQKIETKGSFLHLIKGANHFDLYDIEPYVSEAVGTMEQFFKTHLR